MNREPLAVVAFVLLAGCGSVGEPLPPLLNIPGKVTDLRVAQTADKAELLWTWPLRTTEGSTLRDLERFEVVALDIPAESEPPSIDAFAELGVKLAEVSGMSLPEGGAGEEVSVEIALPDRLGKRTVFAVRGVSSRDKTGPWSEYVIRQILRPADAPEELRAEATALGVRLSWAAVEPADRYVIERGAEAEYSVVGTTDRAEYLDETAPWETELSYRVRSQVGEGAGAVESSPSTAVAISASDVFPPAPPRLVRVVSTGESVELTWAASPEPDLAGYVVSRNGEPAHDGLLESPAFSDGPQPNGTEYRVRAVDEKGNRSETSAPVTLD